MKKYIVIALIALIAISSLNVNGQDTIVSNDDLIIRCDTMYVEEMLKTDYQKYIGMQVKDFLLSDYIRRYRSYLFWDDPPGVLVGLRVTLSGSYAVLIKLGKLGYNKRLKRDGNWDIDLIKEEEVTGITFFHYGTPVLEFE